MSMNLLLDRRAMLGTAFSATLAGSGRARAQASERPVKIGVLGDFSSAYSSMSGMSMVEAVKLAVEDIGGNALGHPIEVVFGDTQLKADIASGIAREWFDRNGVDAIVDLPGSATGLAVMDIATPRKKIVFPTGSYSSEITGKSCSPYTAQWTADTYSVAHSIVPGVMALGGKTWFFITLDSITGLGVESDATDILNSNGGQRLGSVRVPAGSADMAAYLVQAQASNAQVICFSVAGADAAKLMKQASEFGMAQSKQRLVGFFVQTDDVRSVGLQVAEGLIYGGAWDWNLDDQTRAFSKRIFARTKVMPSQNMASAYSAISAYLKAVNALGTRDADKVMKQLRATPIDDVFAKNGRLRIDGRMSHGMYVFQAKTPAQSTSEWDVAKQVGYVAADVAVRPLGAGGCPLVKA